MAVIIPRKIREIKEGIQKTLNPPTAVKRFNYFTKQWDYVKTNTAIRTY